MKFLWSANYSFKSNFSNRSTIRVSNSLYPDQIRFLGPDLGPKLFVKVISRRVKRDIFPWFLLYYDRLSYLSIMVGIYTKNPSASVFRLSRAQ